MYIHVYYKADLDSYKENSLIRRRMEYRTRLSSRAREKKKLTTICLLGSLSTGRVILL